MLISSENLVGLPTLTNPIFPMVNEDISGRLQSPAMLWRPLGPCFTLFLLCKSSASLLLPPSLLCFYYYTLVWFKLAFSKVILVKSCTRLFFWNIIRDLGYFGSLQFMNFLYFWKLFWVANNPIPTGIGGNQSSCCISRDNTRVKSKSSVYIAAIW